jgi:hypothetical protein
MTRKLVKVLFPPVWTTSFKRLEVAAREQKEPVVLSV